VLSSRNAPIAIAWPLQAATTGYGNDSTFSVSRAPASSIAEQRGRIGLEDGQIEPAREHAGAPVSSTVAPVGLRPIEAGVQSLQHRLAHHVGLAVVHRERGDTVDDCIADQFGHRRSFVGRRRSARPSPQRGCALR
jgi:hypothetical protein